MVLLLVLGEGAAEPAPASSASAEGANAALGIALDESADSAAATGEQGRTDEAAQGATG